MTQRCFEYQRVLPIESESESCDVAVLLGSRLRVRSSALRTSGQPKRGRLRKNSALRGMLRVPTIAIKKDKLKAHWWILRPNSRWREVWSIAKDILVMWSVVTTFYFLAVGGPNGGTGEILDISVWVFFVFDFFFNCCTVIYDSKGRPVFILRYILYAYAQKEMLWDVLAILPLQFAGHAEVEHYLRLLRVRKVPDTLNFVDGTGIGVLILPFVNSGKDSKEIGLTSRLIGLTFQLISGILLCTYMLGCFWIWYAKKVEDLPAEKTGSFMESGDVAFDPDWAKLERAWYFLTTTLSTVGYGDYLALNPYERICMIGLQFVGIAAFSTTIGKISTMISEYNSITSPTDTVGEMALWLHEVEGRYSKLPSALRFRIMSHATNCQSLDRLKSLALSWWNAESLEQLTQPSDVYLAELDNMTVKRVFSYLFEDVFSKYKLFFGLNPEFKYDIAFHLQPRQFRPDEEIISDSEVVEEIYFLMSGSVSCGAYSGANQYTALLTYNRRAIMGEYSALTGAGSPVVYKASKNTQVELLALPVRPLQRLLDEKYLDVKMKLLKHAISKMAFIRKTISSHLAIAYSTEMYGLVRRLILSPARLIPETPLHKFKKQVCLMQSRALTVAIARVQKLTEEFKALEAKFWEKRKVLLAGLVKSLDKRAEKKFLSR